ncbi:BTAD domain-containing putative transcriptional regulator [Micromonospora sp. NPDC047548]|uniref:BTAD domain-containing putative transcriptional regulator n=1 Tax=Micromonospora sp. NPDC047548 TaxID=3155624 RepID=UPI0033C515DF
MVRRGGTELAFGAGRQRTLLGRLALTPNEAVTRSELIDLLWPDEPPESAVNLVQTYVTRLRRLLAPTALGAAPGMLRSGPAGYLLRVGPAELDLLRFRELVDQARAARPATALELLTDALAVWRAEPACDVGPLVGHPRSIAVSDERVQAAVRLADLADQLGRHDSSLAVLQALSDTHPLHEPLWGRLILALAANGLQAAALTAYQRIRGRLADELGIDPGPELADFHRRVLRQRWSRTAPTSTPDPVPAPLPAPVPSNEVADRTRPFQVPAPVGDFTGRHDQLRQVCALLRPDRDPAAVQVCAIAGPAGVGKTTLAVQAAHLMRADFVDGQLYADLHGDGPDPARPIDVLSQSLRALGVSAGAIPTDEAECSALYRTTLAARRMLVLLDNARDARQVRPLLPGAGGCGVIVTSRRRLVDLEAANAVDLETLPVDEATDLLAKIAGQRRVLDDPAATATIVRLCGRLPLAVRNEELDLTDFRNRVNGARKAEPSAALEEFEAALALWSGDPLHDVPELSGHPIVTAVLEERIAATLCYADLALAHCQPERCLPLLRALTAANPLHEPLHARLIAALAAGGLQASALDSYADISRRLVNELGIDPSPALVDTHQRVLRQQHGQVRPVEVAASMVMPSARADPPRVPEPPCPDVHPATGRDKALAPLDADELFSAEVRDAPVPDQHAGHGPLPAATSVRAVPSQLPFGVHGFIGRVEEIEQLNRYADTVTEAAVIVGLSGTAGVGKTALAVHWGHQAGHRFPDGCLYVNLNGYGPPEDAETPEEALRVLLDGLGVPPRRLPVGLDARAALYRTVIAGRRVLVVLDNARDAAQVRPLLPAAPGCLALVTSRSSLTGLVAVEGAMSLPLDTLGRDEARVLLTARLGRSRVALESAAVEEIIDGCAGLPLALAITAARAAVAPRRSLAVVARGLTQGARRLDSLASADATIDIRAVFSWSYRLLRRQTARLFRLLGLHTGGSVSAAVAASLAGDRLEEVAAALDELVEVNLLIEVEPGRYAFHDLLRAFSRELISTDPEASAGVRRLLDHYLHTSAEADRHLDAFRWTVPLPPLARGVRPETINDRDEALAWFTAEHAALMASVALAAASEDAAVASHPTRTARNMENYALRAGRWGDAIVASRTALAAARRCGDRIGQALAQHGISRASGYLGDTNGARDAGLRAAMLYHEAGMRVGQADAYRSVATALHNAERFAEAIEVAERQVELYTTHGTAADQAQGFNTYGYLLAGSGRYAEALEPLHRALRLQNSIDDAYGAAFTLDSLGLAYLGTNRLAEAEDHYRRSLELFARVGDRYSMVYPTCGLGDVLAARGDTVGADGMYRRARRLCQEAGLHHLAGNVEDRLRAG